jgi:hypothetical protein
MDCMINVTHTEFCFFSSKEVSGLLSRALHGIVTAREDHISENGTDALLPAASDDLVDAILRDTLVYGRTATSHETAKTRFQKTMKTDNLN